MGAPGLVNFITAVAYHLCLNLPAAFYQPCALTLADLCMWLREYLRQVEAQVISNSRYKLHQTTNKYQFLAKYLLEAKIRAIHYVDMALSRLPVHPAPCRSPDGLPPSFLPQFIVEVLIAGQIEP